MIKFALLDNFKNSTDFQDLNFIIKNELKRIEILKITERFDRRFEFKLTTIFDSKFNKLNRNETNEFLNEFLFFKFKMTVAYKILLN